MTEATKKLITDEILDLECKISQEHLNRLGHSHTVDRTNRQIREIDSVVQAYKLRIAAMRDDLPAESLAALDEAIKKSDYMPLGGHQGNFTVGGCAHV